MPPHPDPTLSSGNETTFGFNESGSSDSQKFRYEKDENGNVRMIHVGFNGKQRRALSKQQELYLRKVLKRIHKKNQKLGKSSGSQG